MKIRKLLFIILGITLGMIILYAGINIYLAKHYIQVQNFPEGFLFTSSNERPTKEIQLLDEWTTNKNLLEEVDQLWDRKTNKCKDKNGDTYNPKTIIYYGTSNIYKFFPLVTPIGGNSRIAIVCNEKYFISDYSGHNAPTFHGPFDKLSK